MVSIEDNGSAAESGEIFGTVTAYRCLASAVLGFTVGIAWLHCAGGDFWGTGLVEGDDTARDVISLIDRFRAPQGLSNHEAVTHLARRLVGPSTDWCYA